MRKGSETKIISACLTITNLARASQGKGYIQLKFSGADSESALVKGRIKFKESEDWTKEGRSREARDTPKGDTIHEDSVRHVKIAAWHTLTHLLH